MKRQFRSVIFLLFVLIFFSIVVDGKNKILSLASSLSAYDTIVGPTSYDPYKDILEVSRAYGALMGVDGCSLAKSMSGVFHVETNGRQNISGATGTFVGSFQMGIPFVKNSLKLLGPDLVMMNSLVKQGKIDKSVYTHMLGAARQGRRLGPNKGRFHHMYSVMLDIAQHVRMEKGLQRTTGSQSERAAAHVAFQFAPAKVESAINKGISNRVFPKWSNNCGFSGHSVAQAIKTLASGRSKCSGRMLSGIQKINCKITSGYSGPSGFGSVPDYTPPETSSTGDLSQYGGGAGGATRDYAPLDKDSISGSSYGDNLNAADDNHNDEFDDSQDIEDNFDSATSTLQTEDNPASSTDSFYEEDEDSKWEYLNDNTTSGNNSRGDFANNQQTEDSGNTEEVTGSYSSVGNTGKNSSSFIEDSYVRYMKEPVRKIYNSLTAYQQTPLIDTSADEVLNSIKFDAKSSLEMGKVQSKTYRGFDYKNFEPSKLDIPWLDGKLNGGSHVRNVELDYYKDPTNFATDKNSRFAHLATSEPKVGFFRYAINSIWRFFTDWSLK